MDNTLKKRLVQLEDLRRREQFSISVDGPMVRLYRESQSSRFGHLPTMDHSVATTPLGHYKARIAQLSLDPQSVMCQVVSRMARGVQIVPFFTLKTSVPSGVVCVAR